MLTAILTAIIVLSLIYLYISEEVEEKPYCTRCLRDTDACICEDDDDD